MTQVNYLAALLFILLVGSAQTALAKDCVFNGDHFSPGYLLVESKNFSYTCQSNGEWIRTYAEPKQSLTKRADKCESVVADPGDRLGSSMGTNPEHSKILPCIALKVRPGQTYSVYTQLGSRNRFRTNQTDGTMLDTVRFVAKSTQLIVTLEYNVAASPEFSIGFQCHGCALVEK